VEDVVLVLGVEEALTDDPPMEPREVKGVKPSFDDSRVSGAGLFVRIRPFSGPNPHLSADSPSQILHLWCSGH
jgi:hypothetical protein